jgi:hypothetical protein
MGLIWATRATRGDRIASVGSDDVVEDLRLQIRGESNCHRPAGLHPKLCAGLISHRTGDQARLKNSATRRLSGFRCCDDRHVRHLRTIALLSKESFSDCVTPSNIFRRITAAMMLASRARLGRPSPFFADAAWTGLVDYRYVRFARR